MGWPFPRIPKLGRRLPDTRDAAEAEFNSRVKKAFPIGSSEADLITALRDEGFAIIMTHNLNSASLTRGLIVKTLWSVRWRAHDDKIEDVFGVYGFIAP